MTFALGIVIGLITGIIAMFAYNLTHASQVNKVGADIIGEINKLKADVGAIKTDVKKL